MCTTSTRASGFQPSQAHAIATGRRRLFPSMGRTQCCCCSRLYPRAGFMRLTQVIGERTASATLLYADRLPPRSGQSTLMQSNPRSHALWRLCGRATVFVMVVVFSVRRVLVRPLSVIIISRQMDDGVSVTFIHVCGVARGASLKLKYHDVPYTMRSRLYLNYIRIHDTVFGVRVFLCVCENFGYVFIFIEYTIYCACKTLCAR